MDDLLSEFLTETNESLESLDTEVVKLERNPNDPELLSSIFRLVHTIKGTCGFLDLPRLEAVAHAGENVLGKVRDGSLDVTPAAVDLILESLDCIKSLLAALEQNGAEPEGDDSGLIARLNAIADGTSAPAAAAPQPAAEPAPTPDAVMAVPAGEAAGEQAGDPAERADDGEGARDGGSSVAAQSVRVTVDMLENLMTMVSELVLSRNQLLQILRTREDSEFAAPLQRLNLVTSDLQEGVMKTRMQPIGNAWSKLPRLIRDLSQELRKKIDLQMLGADTELDRQVLEMIKDPLTHMVRNSGDHGIETPAERVAAGKPETGRIVLNAYHEGGHVIIEIGDDGRGIDIGRVREKVVANGFATAAELDAMSESQIQQFIFKPGFSTATSVTSVSGRGVGMDVVRTNVEKIGGHVELRAAAGRGSTFIVKIPLTLAIVSALIVECAGERFAIPQIGVDELVRVTRTSEHRIEAINDTPVLRLRNRLLPLVALDELLGLGPGRAFDLAPAAGGGRGDGETFIVIARVGTYRYGIVVDGVFEAEEIVVKPVAPVLRDVAVYSGNTILGDGSVIMILDPNGIAAATGEMSLAQSARDAGADAAHDGGEGERMSFLVFRAGRNEAMAVPLALVARIEEIDIETIETLGDRRVVQYRGQLMPLVALNDTVETAEAGRRHVVVFSDGARSMGLMVDEIVDIVEDRLDMELTAAADGIMGTAVIAGRATEVIDTSFYLTRAFGDWFGKGAREGADGTRRIGRVLLVDDSAFFRNLLSPLLGAAGYHVTTADGGERALALREAGHRFDVIISDIEMPGMSGFELAQEIRRDERWRNTPLVALSGHSSQRDLEQGRLSGFTDYVAKLDRDALLNSLSESLAGPGPGDAA